MKELKNINVMHHTHWDREWYETHEEFRYKLRDGLRYVKKLIADGTIGKFFFDGQTMIIDDYKEIVSKEEFEELKEIIKEGKLEIGPWYVLADEFLVSGESLVKNLELGIEISKSLGSKYKIGYLPDTFGHISQMPQVLKQYNIEHAIIWRGAVSETFENNWIASDGSSVLTFVLPLFDGYFQTYLKEDNFQDKLNNYIENNKPYCENGEVLVMNGADHTFTSDNIKVRLKEFKNKNEKFHISEVLMSDFIDKFDSFTTKTNIYEECRNSKKIFTLPGVFSTRMYLKRENQRCEDEALNSLEFLNVWSNGETKSQEFIKYIWKLLIQNHAHDSICGCSIDEVHREMEVRFNKILKGIDVFKKSTLEEIYPFDYISEEFVNDKLYLINNIPFKDNYVVETEIIIPKEADNGSIILKYKDKIIPFEILSREEEEVLFRNIKVFPHYAFVYKYKVRFVMEFDGIESKAITIERSNDIVNSRRELISSKEIENEYYKIKVEKNGLKILDKKNDVWYENQNIVISSLDAGDTYNYSPPLKDVITEAKIREVMNPLKGEVSSEIRFSYNLKTPKGLSEDRTTGSLELVNNNITTVATLIKGSEKILFKTKINNVASDHKVKIGFNVKRCENHYSDTAFDLVKRGVLRNQKLEVGEREELECNQHPTLSTVYANDMQLIHLGMQEYEVTEFKGEDYCFLTAFRAVGDLSRRDLRTRGGGAGPSYKTQEAQCLRELDLTYGLIIGREKFNINNKTAIRSEVLTKQSNIDVECRKLLKIKGDEISYSSIIRKDSGEINLRVYNPKKEEKEIEILLDRKIKSGYLTNLEGEKLKELNITDSKLCLKIEGKKICTLSFK